jgi:hypothetical protein
VAKYSSLATTQEFVPIAVETLGPLNTSGLALLSTIGKRSSHVTGDPREGASLPTFCSLFAAVSFYFFAFHFAIANSTFAIANANDSVAPLELLFINFL